MVRDDDTVKESAREFVLVQNWSDGLSRRSART
jgi:hypothetical protein